MPIKRPQFINGEIYHIILRGIAGQKTFLETKDYLRYLFSLHKFNDKKTIVREYSWRESIPIVLRDGFPVVTALSKKEKSDDFLIEIFGLCLMSNHVHLLVRQVADNEIPLFFQKMGGYSSYFNKKHQRFGGLFQRPFKAVHIKTEDQLLIVFTYIHLNPIDLVESNWKKEGISNSQKVIKFLESYPWSSYSHYLGKINLSWLINSDFLNKVLKNSEDFRNFVEARVSHKAELKNFLEKARNFSLE